MSKKSVSRESDDSTASWQSALTDGALRAASSPKIFERGQTYAASGKVVIALDAKQPERSVRATVHGTEPYTTEIWIDEDDSVDGDCDCPHAQDGWFCKHQVAVALVWRNRLAGTEVPVDPVAQKKVEASAKRAQTVKNQAQALHDFLHGLDRATLANKLLELADQDRDIAKTLQHWRKLSTSSLEPADLKRLITEMLSPGRDFVDWRGSYAFARQAETVLPLLQQATARDPASAVVLSAHAMRRMWLALESADDSDGDISGVCQQIGDAWVTALEAAGTQPAAFGETYLQLLLDDPFGSFNADAAEAAMGATALARYRHVLAQRWQLTLKAVQAARADRPKKAGSRSPPMYVARSEAEYQLDELERLHRSQLEKMGETDAVLSLLRADLSEPHAHCAVVTFLEKHNRFREAMAQAEIAYKHFPDDWRVQADLLRCYERDGWTAEALTLRRRQFDASPDVERFQQVLKAASVAGRDVAAMRIELFAQIEARELAVQAKPVSTFSQRWASHGGSAAARNVSLRAAILCAEKRWQEAATLAQPPVICDIALLRQIALHLPAAEVEQSVALLLRVFEVLMPRASTPYTDVLALVVEITIRMQSLRRKSWLEGLHSVYKAKRNFIKGLPQP